MPSGEMRRPPQPWESKLARLTSIIGGAGIKSSGDGTSIVAPTPTPGTGGGTEPAPVLPPPGAFIKPSTPTLLGQVQGINVIWNGLNSASELWPYDTSWVEIHMSTAGTAFTPGTATLKGRLTRPGAYSVGGLTAGTAYYFKLRGADPAGNYTDPSDAATGYTGQTIAGDLGVSTVGTAQISFNARTIGGVTNSVQATAPSNPLTGDVWLDTSPGTAVIHKVYNGSTWVTNAWGSASIAAGQITALQLAAGAVTAGAITAGTVNGWYIQGGTIAGNYITGGTIAGGYISGGTISGGYISSGTITGASITTAASGARVAMNDGGRAAYLDIYSNNGSQHTLYGDLGDLIIDPSSRCKIAGNVQIEGDLDFVGAGNGDITATSLSTSAGIDITGSAVDMVGVYNNDTATTIDNVGITTGYRLRRRSSRQAIKYDITALSSSLADSVDAARRSDVATVNPADVLKVAVVEFSAIESGNATDTRVLGFIAEDVEQKFPIAVTRLPDGSVANVADTPMIAALLAVVQQQQADITALTARIEALEG